MLRFTPSRATGMSPFEAAFGFEPHTPTLLHSIHLEQFDIDYGKLEEEAERYNVAETMLRLH